PASPSANPVIALHYPSTPPSAVTQRLNFVVDARDYLSSKLGPYRWPRLAYVEAPLPDGAMEHASAVTGSEGLFAYYDSVTIPVHELSHHWAGNLVPLRSWNDFWLSEGFAEYWTTRYFADRNSGIGSTFQWRKMFRSALSAEQFSTHPLRPADPEG